MTVGKIIIGKARDKQSGAADAGSDAGFSHTMHSDGALSAETKLPGKIQKLIAGSGADHQSQSYEKRAKVIRDSGLTLILYPTESENIISIAGSFDFAGTAYHDNPLVPSFTALMLDKGTQRHSKLQIAEMLEDRGAQMTFSTDYEHARFNVKCLTKDLPAILSLLFEQLREPAFDPDELEKAKARQRVAIEQAMASTSAMGMNHLSEKLFPEGHPNHNVPLEEQLELLNAVDLAVLQKFYDEHYGKQNLIISIAGDFDSEAAARMIQDEVNDWSSKAEGIAYERPQDFKAGGLRENVTVPGVVNYDVFMGHPVPLTRLDKDYLGLYAATYILGGDFSARLSSTIRDQYGYTYGIRSGIIGVSESLTGAWVVHLIVNPPLLEKAIAQTKSELKKFVEKGISERELENAKITIAGKFKVGLATTDALAVNLLQAEERGMGVAYLDRFPDEIAALNPAQVNEDIRRYYKPDELYVLTAGEDLPA